MRNFLGDFSAQLKGIWSRLDGGQRLVVVSVLLATLAGIGGMVWFAGRPSYETVYTATSGEDAKAAQRALQDANIPYVASGLSFQVERSKSVDAGLAIQGAGLSNGGSANGGGTSSIIDDADTRAWKLMQQSISRVEVTVAGLAGVAGARINASPAKRTRAFVDRDRESRPTATVLLSLKAGASFVDVRGAAASMAAAQLGIPTENVTVVNAQSGARWQFDPDRDSANGGTSDFRAMERALSAERSQSAQDQLDRAWPGKATVTVNVELDPKWELVSEKVLPPSNDILRSEDSTKDSTSQKSGTSGTAGGTGNRSASSGSAGTEPSTTENTTKNEKVKREFVTEIGERRSGRQAAEIKRITVSLFYDKSLAAQGSDFDPKNLESAVKAMVGWDKARDTDDGFSMLATDFAPVDLTAIAAPGGGIGELVVQWGPTVGQVLGVAVVLLFLRGLLKRSAKSTAAAAAAAAAEPAPVKPDSPEELQRKMRKEIERAIASDPATLAKLLETWLIEQNA